MEWRHYCPLGCHDSEQAAKEDICNDVDEAHLSMGVSVPALNRWLKIFDPEAFWCVGTVANYLPESFEEATRPGNDSRDDNLTASELMGVGTESTFRKMMGKRWRMATDWMTAEATALMLCVGCVLLVPIVLLMGAFFADSRLDKQEHWGLLDFCLDHRNPAWRTCTRFINMLRDINDRAWLPLVGFSGWSEMKFAVAATEAYKIVAGLWFRLVYTFSKWPWRLAKAFDLGAPREERLQICKDFLRCDPEHLEPGLARQIRGLVTTADELVDSEEVRSLVMNTFKKVGSQNIGNEDRFARQKRFAQSCHGHCASHTTVAHKHLLAEAVAQHGIAMDKFARGGGLAPQAATKVLKGWQAFVHLNSKSLTKDLKPRWRSLTPGEKASITATKLLPTTMLAVDVSIVRERTPWGIGDRSYSLSVPRCLESTCSLMSRSKQWRTQIGGLVNSAGTDLQDTCVKQCCDVYGAGKCINSLCDVTEADAFKKSLKACHRRLWAMSKLPTSCFSDVEAIPLFSLRRDDLDPRSFLRRCVLMPFRLYSPGRVQVYWDCYLEAGCNLEVGSVMHVSLNWPAALETTTEMAMWMLEAGGTGRITVLEIKYTFLSLTRLRVADVIDQEDALRQMEKGTILEDELDVIKKQHAKARRVAKKRATKGVPHPPGGAPSSPVEDDELLVASESHESDADYEEEIEDIDVGAHVDIADAWADAEEETEEHVAPAADHLPKIVYDSDTVICFFNPKNSKDRWGKTSLTWTGTPNESVKLYCNLHGCHRLRKTVRFPAMHHIRQWFADGAALPRGAAGQGAHLRMFDDIPLPGADD